MKGSPVAIVLFATAACAADGAATMCAAPGACEDGDAAGDVASLLQYKDYQRFGDWVWNFEGFAGKNCYAGHGAQELETLKFAPSGLGGWERRSQRCQAACLADPACQAFTMKSGGTSETCWKRRHVDLDKCVSGTEFTTSLKITPHGLATTIEQQGLNPDAFRCRRRFAQPLFPGYDEYEYECQLGRLIVNGRVRHGVAGLKGDDSVGDLVSVSVSCEVDGATQYCHNGVNPDLSSYMHCQDYVCNPDCSECGKKLEHDH